MTTMKSRMRTMLLALTMFTLLLPQSLRAAQAGVGSSAEQRLVQLVDELNQLLNEIAGDDARRARFSNTPTDVVFTFETSIPTDPEELAEIHEDANRFEVKTEYVSDLMAGDSDLDDKFRELVQEAVSANHGLIVDYVDPIDPTNLVSMNISSDELKYALDHLEEYIKRRDEAYSSDDIEDLLAYEGIDAEPDSAVAVMPDYIVDPELLEDAPTNLELMMAKYGWDNRDRGCDDRIWREDDLVIVSLVSNPEMKEELATFINDEDLGVALMIGMADDTPLDEDEETEVDFNWRQFFFLVYYLDYDLEFRIGDNADDPNPLVLPVRNNQIGPLF